MLLHYESFLNSLIIPSVIVGRKISSWPLKRHWEFQNNFWKQKRITQTAPFSNIDNLTELLIMQQSYYFYINVLEEEKTVFKPFLQWIRVTLYELVIPLEELWFCKIHYTFWYYFSVNYQYCFQKLERLQRSVLYLLSFIQIRICN